MPNKKTPTKHKASSSRRKSARIANRLSSSSSSASSDSVALSGDASFSIETPRASPPLPLPPAPNGVGRDADLTGHQLVGREILICWEDGQWYDAIVVRYFPHSDEYKLAYRADEGIEIAPLRDRRWTVAPKKSKSCHHVILDGAIIEFVYPPDGQRYKAMVFDASANGDKIKIAYLEEHTTDTLKGGGWDFLTTSPCISDDSPEMGSLYLQEAVNAMGQSDSRSGRGAVSKVSSGRVSKSSRTWLSSTISSFFLTT